KRPQIAAWALLERVVVGAVDHDHVQMHPGDADAPDRLTAMRVPAVMLCLGGDRALLGSERYSPELLGAKGGRALVVLRCELVLLPRRVERGERVLPLPDEKGPEQGEDPGGGQDSAENAQ